MTRGDGDGGIFMENYELRQKVKQLNAGMNEIHMILFSIGGPLNDSVKKYTKKQMRVFFKIASVVDGFGGNDD